MTGWARSAGAPSSARVARCWTTAPRGPDSLMGAVEADLLDRIRVRLAAGSAEATHAQVAAALRAEGRLVGDSAVLEVVDALRLDSVGAGPLEPLLRQNGVTDVLVNGPREVYVDTGRGLRPVDVAFADDA